MSDQALQSRSSYEHSKTKTLSLPPNDNPRNWPTWKKWALVSSIVFVDLTVSWGASGFSPASTKFAKDFGVSSEIGTLGLSIYVAGLALGPMSLAPLSEVCNIIFMPLRSTRLTSHSTLDGRHCISFHMDASYSFCLALLSYRTWVDFWSCDSCRVYSHRSLLRILEAPSRICGTSDTLESPCLYSYGRQRVGHHLAIF